MSLSLHGSFFSYPRIADSVRGFTMMHYIYVYGLLTYLPRPKDLKVSTDESTV